MQVPDLRTTTLVLALILGSPLPSARAQGGGEPTLREVPLAAHGTSRPLRSYQTRNRATPVINKTVRTHRPTSRIAGHTPSAPLADPIRQDSGAPTGEQLTPAGFGFEGLSDDDNAAVAGLRLVPPDTQGDVSPNHYIQMINVIFAVYDKSIGQIVDGGGPFPNNALWDGFGGPCESQNDGDPIVLYDHLVDRWVFSQFAVPGYQCFAISATSDPLGEYHLYQFLVSPGFLGLIPDINDYPKIGLWPDAYYMSFNEFSGLTGGYNGVVVAAFPREQMLGGQVVTGIREGPLQCDSECYFSLQPSHLEGPPPPAGTPNTFVMAFDDQAWGTGTGTDGYRLWDFAVNWDNPLSSTFTPRPQADTVPFDAVLCGGARDCIPQPAPGERVDSLSVFTMYRAQYRNFGTHQTLVLDHSVDAGNDVAGVRWAELRKTGAETEWSVYQTGTYAPNDGLHRWMGSIAMDGAGNIGLGYSVSSELEFPSIRYTSRSAGDPPGVMAGGEQTMVAGTLVQTASSNRWGDYSSMSVDPADGCTFWYTQEYQANDFDGQTSFDFKTWIGSFRLPDCGAAAGEAPLVTILSPGSGSVHLAGQAVTFQASADDPEDGDLGAMVEWTSSLDGPIGTGAIVETSALTVGAHEITASVTDGDGMSGSDQVNITIAAEPDVSTAAHVASVAAGAENLEQGRKRGVAAVVIHDENGDPVVNATVLGTFSGTFSEPASAVTDAGGLAELQTAGTARQGVEVAFCVTDVTHASLSYDPDSNVMTCSFDSPGGPAVTIVSPEDGAAFDAGVAVTFEASATEAGGADIGGSIVWTDNGVSFGSGPTVTISDLAPGSHAIVALATDSGGLSGSDQITVQILGGAATSMRVLAVATGTLNEGQGNKRGMATVTIVDNLGSPVAGASVTGMFSGTFNEEASAVTGPGGDATLVTAGTARGGVSVSFCVSGVTGSLDYDPAASAGVCP